MRIISETKFLKQKIVFVFLLAILVPVLIVGYLSFNTFFKRQEAVRNLLESNFLASGELALRSIEDTMFEYEKNALKPDNFLRLSKKQENVRTLNDYLYQSELLSGKLFLLNEKFQTVVPLTEYKNESFLPWQEDLLDNPFADSFRRAEYYEFSQKDYSRAANLYLQCISLATSQEQKAIVLESIGRSLISSKQFSTAYSVYRELSLDYSHFRNKAGHPYGIIAAFQKYAIDQRLKREEKSYEILLDLYEKITNGVWPINLSSYDFFITEIESSLEDVVSKGKFPNIQNAYTSLRRHPSPYKQTLLFTEFLKTEAIPKIKEKLALMRLAEEAPSGRFPARLEEDISFISFNILPEFQEEKTYYGGFLWDMKPLKNTLLPKILERVSQETGLRLNLFAEEEPSPLSDNDALISKDSLALSFKVFPFPWKLRVIQPAFKEQERTAKRENIFYGFLLAGIVVLIFLGAFLIVRDISRESETMRLKSEFVHNVSHELKTPLTLIRLYAETLQRKGNLKSEQKQEAYQIITKESERLSHMINNVLDFARIEMGKKEFNFEKGELSSLVLETLDSYKYHLEKKGFTIHTDIAADLPETRFDREAMASVVINLLSNAMKFSPQKKEVTIRLYSENDNVVLKVADKGTGINPKEMNRIFERFYRIKDQVVSETRGSGLGLPLAKHIIEAHGGKIKVESEPGKGSVFYVILPVSRLNKGEA